MRELGSAGCTGAAGTRESGGLIPAVPGVFNGPRSQYIGPPGVSILILWAARGARLVGRN